MDRQTNVEDGQTRWWTGRRTLKMVRRVVSVKQYSFRHQFLSPEMKCQWYILVLPVSLIVAAGSLYKLSNLCTLVFVIAFDFKCTELRYEKAILPFGLYYLCASSPPKLRYQINLLKHDILNLNIIQTIFKNYFRTSQKTVPLQCKDGLLNPV